MQRTRRKAVEGVLCISDCDVGDVNFVFFGSAQTERYSNSAKLGDMMLTDARTKILPKKEKVPMVSDARAKICTRRRYFRWQPMETIEAIAPKNNL
ncbi:hypothetical protein R1flu_016141 [Riccia fluitans]|uniref:Uncharacterized protein n=1 Tax=Riccia fluitans TaxID=41844 RepID=A0ABD1YLC7_9MARC